MRGLACHGKVLTILISLICLAVNADDAAPKSISQHVVNAMNTTFGDRAATQLQYELRLDEFSKDFIEVPKKNKIILSLILSSGLGCLGFDRCYMGQPILGMWKGVTMGGFIIMGVIDHMNIFFNCILMKPAIGVMNSTVNSTDYMKSSPWSMGFHGQFGQGELIPAFFIVVLAFSCYFVAWSRAPVQHPFLDAREKNADLVNIDEDPNETTVPYVPLLA